MVNRKSERRFGRDWIALKRCRCLRVVRDRRRTNHARHPGGSEPALVDFIGKGLGVLMERRALAQDAPTFGLGHFVFGSRRHGTLAILYAKSLEC